MSEYFFQMLCNTSRGLVYSGFRNKKNFRMALGMKVVEDNRNTFGWSLDSGYTNKTDSNNYPFQAIQERNTLMLLVATLMRDINNECNGGQSGFKVILSMPGEIVDTSQNYLLLPLAEEVHVEIKTTLTITSDRLRGYTPKQRGCFFNSENPLRFFKMYTKNNCRTECLSNFTKIECGCVKFSMPSMSFFFQFHKTSYTSYLFHRG